MNASSKKFSSELENTSKYVVKYNKQINKLTFSPDVDHITKNRCIEQVDGQEEYFPSFHASIESNPLDLNDGNNENNSVMRNASNVSNDEIQSNSSNNHSSNRGDIADQF